MPYFAIVPGKNRAVEKGLHGSKGGQIPAFSGMIFAEPVSQLYPVS
jgi:hypothetical protein